MALPMEECASAFVADFADGRKLVIKDLGGFTISRDLANVEFDLVQAVTRQMAQEVDQKIMEALSHTGITAEGNILDPETLKKAIKEMACKRCGQFHVSTGRLFKCDTCGAVLCEDQVIAVPRNVAEDEYSHPVWAKGADSFEYECGPCHVIKQPPTDQEVLAHGFDVGAEGEGPIKKGGPSGGLERFKKYFASKGASKTVVTGT